MRAVRFPLYAKILTWFFLNLMVLGIIAAVLLRLQFAGAPELLVAGAAGDRLQAVSTVIRNELLARPRADWDGMLERFGRAYSVTLQLVRNDGGHVAGEKEELPREVLERIKEPRFSPRGRPFADRPGERDLREPGEPGERPRMERRRGEGAGVPEDRLPPLEEREMRLRREEQEMIRDVRESRPVVRFIARTQNPKRYWIGLPMPVPERPGGPGVLVLSTASIRAGGLLLDFSGWAWVAAGAAVFSMLFWLPLVRNITRSISDMRGATVQIAEGNFEARADEHRQDELGSLGGAINRMAQRLGGFVSGQKRFLGDIAHELCSPLARMQVALGILEERGDTKQAAYVQDVREEVQQMSNLVNELLSFSKASLGGSTVQLQPVSLGEIAERAIKRETTPAVEMRSEIAEDMVVSAEPELLLRALANLLRNAARYAGEAGPIVIQGRRDEGMVEMSVRDQGPGVPESELTKLFDPFYRVDTSRARETGGTGLGLAIVKTCIEACGGTVRCRNAEPKGLEVLVRLKVPTNGHESGGGTAGERQDPGFGEG